MRYCLLFLVVFAFACEPRTGDASNFSMTGYAPVYASAQAANTIAATAPKATVHAGKIYAYGNYLFQVEQNEGIHIINNTSPQNAQKIAFLSIPTCSEIAIKGGFLYTNNLNDLVVFDLSNITSPQLVNRVKDAFPAFSQSYPPASNAYFECPDPAKGVVVGWEEKTLTNPKCRR